MAEFAQKLGARIVQLRKEHKFAQERLATLARMNKGYLSSVESGQRIPSVGMLAKLSKALQVPLCNLFVFPDGGPWERLLEELRHGNSPAAEQLRSQFGLSSTTQRSTKSGKSTTRRKSSKADGKTTRERSGSGTARKTSRNSMPNRGAKRRR